MIDPLKFPDPTSTDMKVNLTAGKLNELIEYLRQNEPVKASESILSPENCQHDDWYFMNKKHGIKKCKKCKKVWK